MNARALMQNPWFQLCLLVAVLSGGTSVYNLFSPRPIPPTPTPGPQPPGQSPAGQTAQSPARTPTQTPSVPTPIVKIKAKTASRWIVDSAGASDADSRDLPAVLASLSDGDAITLRSGTYTGGGEIIQTGIKMIGPGGTAGVATVRLAEARPLLVVAGKGTLAVENVSFSAEASADFPALRVSNDAKLELRNCKLTTKGAADVLVGDNATCLAAGSTFQAPSGGSCLKYVGSARGTVTSCTLSVARWGMQLFNSAQVQASDCTFQQIGLVNGDGFSFALNGNGTSATLTNCQFLNNNSAVLAEQDAVLQITGSVFRNNGTGDLSDYAGHGLVLVSSRSRVTLRDDTFESNKQGVTVNGGGHLELERVQLRNTGLTTSNPKIKPYCQTLGVSDAGSTLTLTNVTISDALQCGVVAVSGSQLKMTGGSVKHSAIYGLLFGFTGNAPARAEIRDVEFSGNTSVGVVVGAGSTLEMQNCVVSDNSSNGFEVSDANTQARISGTAIRSNKQSGLDAYNSATATLTNCTLERNQRGAMAGESNNEARRGTITLEGCVVRDNSQYGIGAYRGSQVVFRHGAIGGQQGQNIFQENGGTVRIER